MKNQKVLTGSIISVLITFILLIVSPALPAQEKGSFKDARDGRTYQWVKVGKKAWMAENLKYNAPSASWFFSNDTAHALTYGRLYTHTAAMTSCPKGWRLPTDNDWAMLIEKLGGTAIAGEKMQAFDSIYWAANPNLPATAKTLSSVLGGVRHADSTFSGVGIWGGLWSATVVGDAASDYLFARGDKGIGKSSNDINSAFGVRCVKK